MKFWKIPELDQDMENFLSTMLTPVSLRGRFPHRSQKALAE